MKTIVIIEDHPLYRAAIEQALGGAGYEVISEEKIDKALEPIGRGGIDLVLLDLQMPDVLGFEGIGKIRACAPESKIAILSAHVSDELVSKAIHFGADAYLTKSAAGDELKSSIEQILKGERVIPKGVHLQHQHQLETINLEDAMNRLSSLTPQQTVILNKLCDGKLNKQIAYELEISETTVKAHITAILRKLGVVNRTQAVLVANSMRVDAEGQPFSGAGL